MGKTSFIILALILYLSTFPLGNCKCTKDGGFCEFRETPDYCIGQYHYGVKCPNCCKGLMCYGYECRKEDCHKVDDSCDTDKCCEPLQCLAKTKTCQECTPLNSPCGYSIANCCSEYSCHTKDYTCQIYLPEGSRCTEGDGSCCNGLTCFKDSTSTYPKCTKCQRARGNLCGSYQNKTGCCSTQDLTCHYGMCQHCTVPNTACGYLIPDCCTGYSCHTNNYTCQSCTRVGQFCLEGDGSCCPDLTCFSDPSSSPYCVKCTPKYSQCGEGYPSCCKGLSCFKSIFHDYMCVDCVPDISERCGDDRPDCCGPDLKCYNNSCRLCGRRNSSCNNGSAPDCCPGLSCSANSQTCQPCTVENDACTDAEDALPCCGNLSCFDGTCQKCIAENDTCTDAEDTVAL